MTPKVLFIDQSGVMGGAELSLLDIAKSYKDACKVVLLSDGPFRQKLCEAQIEVDVVNADAAMKGVRRESTFAGLLALPSVLSLAKYVAHLARNYDLIYANSQKAFAVAALASKIARKPLLWHLRDILTREHFSAFNCRFLALLANLAATRVIANSQATAAAFVAAGGHPGKINVVHNGIDSSQFLAVTDQDRQGVRQALTISQDTPLIGVFSRLARWKGQHVLIEALAGLPGVHVLFVGEALFGEEAYANELVAQADRCGVSERVHFLGFRKDIHALMKAVDIVAHTSIAPEPFGRVIVEGMLAERAVIATRAGGAMEIIEDGVNGILTPPGDADCLKEKVAGLLGDVRKRQSLARAGALHAARHFSLPVMLNNIDQHLLAIARPH